MNKQVKAFFYSVVVALGGFVFGLDAAVISGTVKFITAEFGLNDLQVGTAVSAPGFGVLIALLITPWLCNRFGRKKTLILISALYWVSAVTSALAPTYWSLVAARFLGGLAFTSLTVAAMYIGEVAPPRWRGKLVSINQMNIVFGLSAAYFVNYFLIQAMNNDAGWAVAVNLKENIWRFMLGSEIIPAFIWLGLLFLIPESPRWLVYRGRIEEAKAIMHRITPDDEIDGQVKAMEESLHHGTEELSGLSQFRELFHKRMRLVVVVAVVIAVAQQLSGINAILFYAPTVFEQLGGGTDAAFAQSLWVGLVSVIFTLGAILLVDRLGRRPLILIGLMWVVVSHSLCWWGFNTARYTLSEEAVVELPAEVDAAALKPMLGQEFKSDIAFKSALIDALGETEARVHSAEILKQSADMNATLILIGILSFISAFHFSLGPVMWVLFSELFPTSLRGVAIPFFVLISSVISFLVQKFFPWQLANMGGEAIFMFYGIVALVGFVWLLPILPETKNLSIEEIQLKLERK
ncbi:D-xylose-proton symporter [Pontiella desulfatans]|uniref:D-xylose-proton symporter n=1 Tax=Pontiella desulfatans TaxID=2750659 RepID=A0A6C2TYQ7_PONDE|nr:sugar porter family MFS transporter [Pontiella desulfatans]VGO12782.1 D-xylose-proton symporter [Pontiella desulfatans]